MKKKWSPHWKASSQARKQRKFRHNAPLHTRRKFLGAHLSKEIRKQYQRRSLPVRKGDEVKVMVGSFTGKTGTVDRVDVQACKVYLTEIKVKKVDGTEVMRPLDPSNLLIIKLALDDKERVKILERSHSGTPSKPGPRKSAPPAPPAGQRPVGAQNQKSQPPAAAARQQPVQQPIPREPLQAAGQQPAPPASQQPAAPQTPGAPDAKKGAVS